MESVISLDYLKDKTKDNNNYILFFYADWLPHLKRTFKMLESVKDKEVFLIDVDRSKDIKENFKIDEIPTFKLFNFNNTKTIKGFVYSSYFHNMLKSFFN